MIYHVEGGEQVQDSENGNLSLVSVAKKAVGDMKKSSLSVMALAISKLFKFKVIVGDMLNQLMKNDSQEVLKETAGYMLDGHFSAHSYQD